jgi:hypothetical protein
MFEWLQNAFGGLDQGSAQPEQLLEEEQPEQQFNPEETKRVLAGFGMSPDEIAYIERLPEEEQAEFIINNLGKKKPAPQKSNNFNREEALRRIPEGSALGDSDLEDLYRTLTQKRAEEKMKRSGEAQGPVGYEQRKGAKLKIVQDEAFLRAGYKSGDTVCIKIP